MQLFFLFSNYTHSSWFLFPGNGCTISRKLANLPLLPHRICCPFARYPLAPVSISLEDLSRKHQKYIHISFRPFFPPSDVSLFLTRSSTQEKILSVFVLLSHSLNLLVNEIEVPFTNSILVKNGTRQAILLLFTVVKGFELAFQRYKFTTFSNRLD